MSLESNKVTSQRGAALILALLIVSIVVILAATLASDFLLALRRVENQLHGQQAYAYLRGVEVMAKETLQRDYKNGNTKDHFSDLPGGWLEREVQVPIGQGNLGMLKGRLSDLQARFNLNSLGSAGATGEQRDYSPEQLQFVRLLIRLPLEEPLDSLVAEEIMRAVTDWIDANDMPDPRGGAESDYYSSLDLPMKAGNQPLQSVSELLWVKGMTKEIYAELKPFVTALPKKVLLNVNTASAEVLQTLVENEFGSEGEQIQYNRDGEDENPSKGFETLEEFQDAYFRAVGSDEGGHSGEAKEVNNVQIYSEYFLLTSETLFLDRVFQMKTVLYRKKDDGTIKVIARSYTDI